MGRCKRVFKSAAPSSHTCYVQCRRRPNSLLYTFTFFLRPIYDYVFLFVFSSYPVEVIHPTWVEGNVRVSVPPVPRDARDDSLPARYVYVSSSLRISTGTDNASHAFIFTVRVIYTTASTQLFCQLQFLCHVWRSTKRLHNNFLYAKNSYYQ